MPIYEYLCSHCQHQFDLLQKMSDPPEKTCPHCGKSTATRLVSAAAFQLKGTGWYATDFKNKDKPPAPAKKETSGGDKQSGGTQTSSGSNAGDSK